MGQHKFNPNCQKDKSELPPKEKRMSKREREAYLRSLFLQALAEKSPETIQILGMLDEKY